MTASWGSFPFEKLGSRGYSCRTAIATPPPHFDVVLRHRLLRQPGGFEGFLVVPEELKGHVFAVANRVEARQLDACLRPLALASPDKAHHDPVTNIDEVGDHFRRIDCPGNHEPV